MRLKAKQKIDLVLDYLSMGLDLDSLDLEMSLDDFVSFIYPREYDLLQGQLGSYDVLRYMDDFDRFKSKLFSQFLKEGMYTLCLFLCSYVLSWFFLTKFSVSVLSMIESFEVNVSMIYVYQTLVQVYLFIIHILLIFCIICIWLLQSHDLRTLLYILIHKRVMIIREYVSYRFALLMSLFTKYGIKTQSMIEVLRSSSLDSFSQWLAYHVENELKSGKTFSEAINLSFFDQRFILLIDQGLRRHVFENNLNLYVESVRNSLEKQMSLILKIIKFFVFLYLVLLMAMYYAVLYMPMQIMEVL